MASDNISIKKSKALYISLSILFTGFWIYFLLGPYKETRYILYEGPFWSIPFLLCFLSISVYCLYGAFDNKPVITFSPEGITHKKKTIPWTNIKGYKTIDSPVGKKIATLALTLNTSGREYKIDLMGLNTNETHIQDCIKAFSDHL